MMNTGHSAQRVEITQPIKHSRLCRTCRRRFEQLVNQVEQLMRAGSFSYSQVTLATVDGIYQLVINTEGTILKRPVYKVALSAIDQLDLGSGRFATRRSTMYYHLAPSLYSLRRAKRLGSSIEVQEPEYRPTPLDTLQEVNISTLVGRSHNWVRLGVR